MYGPSTSSFREKRVKPAGKKWFISSFPSLFLLSLSRKRWPTTQSLPGSAGHPMDSHPLCLLLRRPVTGSTIPVPQLLLIAYVRVFNLHKCGASSSSESSGLWCYSNPLGRSWRSSGLDSYRLLVAARSMFLVRACGMMRFSVKRFKSIQGFNDDECGSRALVLRGTCAKTSRLSGRGVTRVVRWLLILAAVVIIWWSLVWGPFFWFLCTSDRCYNRPESFFRMKMD